MAGRLFDWFHKRGAYGEYAAEVRKALGAVAERVSKGLTSLRYRVPTADGKAQIDVGIYGKVPFARVISPDDADAPDEFEACSWTMYSGMLNLGTTTENSEVTSGRFRVFDTSQPALEYGDTVDCTGMTPVSISGLVKGRLGVNATVGKDKLKSACEETPEGPFIKDSVIPNTDPVRVFSVSEKKQTQWHIPASMYSGLMRAYVQAMYGNPDAVYVATDDGYGIQIQTSHPDGNQFITAFWGGATVTTLVEFDGALYLHTMEVDVPSNTATSEFRRLLISDCAKKLLLAYKRDNTKLAALAAALADGIPAAEATATVTTPFSHGYQVGVYLFSASRAGEKAIGTFYGDAGRWQLVERTTSLVDGEFEVAFAVLQDGLAPSKAGWMFGVLYPNVNEISVNEQLTMEEDDTAFGPAEHAVSYDTPVAAYYDLDDKLVVATFKHSVSSTAARVPELPSIFNHLCGDFDGNELSLCTSSGHPPIYYFSTGVEVKRDGVLIYSTVQVGTGYGYDDQPASALRRMNNSDAPSATEETQYIESGGSTSAFALGTTLTRTPYTHSCAQTSEPGNVCHATFINPDTGVLTSNPCSALDDNGWTYEVDTATRYRCFGFGCPKPGGTFFYAATKHDTAAKDSVTAGFNSMRAAFTRVVIPYGDASSFVLRRTRYEVDEMNAAWYTYANGYSKLVIGAYNGDAAYSYGCTAVTSGGEHSEGWPPALEAHEVVCTDTGSKTLYPASHNAVFPTFSASEAVINATLHDEVAAAFTQRLFALEVDAQDGDDVSHSVSGVPRATFPSCSPLPQLVPLTGTSPLLVRTSWSLSTTTFHDVEVNWPHAHRGVFRMVTSVGGASVYQNDWLSGNKPVDNNIETFTAGYTPAPYFSFIGHA